MFFIDFPILSYAIQPRTTAGIWYTEPYANPSLSSLLSTYRKIIASYESNTLLIKNLSLLELLFF